MHRPARLAASFALLVVLAPLALAQKKSKPVSNVPEVGAIAPPIGTVQWLDLGSPASKTSTDLASLRGSVVIVADYGYYCDSCVRVGVPTLNALRAANADEGLRVIQLTAGIGDDTSETIRGEGEKLGVVGPVGVTDVEGQGSPYLDMGANGNLTFAYVIGRHGGITWKGDPSRKHDEYVAAVASALHAVPCEPLPASHDAFGPELAPALREYVLGDVAKAGADALALQKKLATKTGVDAERVRGEIATLLALVDATRKALMDALEKSAGDKNAERFQKALENVRRTWSKGPESDRAGSLEMFMTIQSDQGPSCRRWQEWYALEAARPATFPAEKDPAGTKYARELAKYLKLADVPGLERAKAWLDAFEKLPEKRK